MSEHVGKTDARKSPLGRPPVRREILSQEPHSFAVFGLGMVFKKYWLSSPSVHVAQLYDVRDASEIAVIKDNPLLQSKYTRFSDSTKQEIYTDLATRVKKGDVEHIALLVPADVRLAMAQDLLKTLPDSAKLFLEKPFARTLGELDQYATLLEMYGDRLHFSGKYATGRADLLYEALQVMPIRVPTALSASLIEGGEYYDHILRPENKSQLNTFRADGPQLDLGFHLMDIATRIVEVLQLNTKGLRVVSTYDLSQVNSGFMPGFGFAAELDIVLSDGTAIPLSIKAGKGRVDTDRHFLIHYDDFALRQDYTVGSSTDPVSWIDSNGQRTLLGTHEEGHNYYTRELERGVFGRRPVESSRRALEVNRLCILMKK